MNKLLIHNQNTVLIENQYFTKEEQFYFDVDSDLSDIDIYIHEQLTTGDLRKKIELAEIIFIKVALTQNYLEYAGIRLAYHIRLTKDLKDKALLPIVFVSEETYEFLGLTCEIPQILFSSGIYLMRDNKVDYRKHLDMFKSSKVRPLNDKETFVSKLKIIPSSNHTSHHSIANEWSLLRWSELLSIELNEPLTSVKQNVESSLYYKYLLALNPIEEKNQLTFSKIDSIDKILYIDDEWNKGWKLVLNQLLIKSGASNFKTLEYSFKDSKPEDTIAACKAEINSFDPNVVILDLRLCDQDFTIKKTDSLTGYILLDFIKKLNPGIQVIIFSASNKVWNLIELQKAEADDFILKDSPETSKTSESISNLINALNKASQRTFLKELIQKCNIIDGKLTAQINPSNHDYNDFINDLKSKLKICMASLKAINLEKPSTTDIAFLSFYNFLEAFKYYINYDIDDYAYYIGFDKVDFKMYRYNNGTVNTEDKSAPKRHEKPSWSKSLSALFIDYFKISCRPFEDIKNIETIQKQRNDYIHSDKIEFSKYELITIVDLCLKSCSNLKD